MDPIKVIVLGSSPGPIKGIIDALKSDGDVVELKTRGDFLGDAQVLRSRPPKEYTFESKRRTGAAAIKRASKKAKRRK